MCAQTVFFSQLFECQKKSCNACHFVHSFYVLKVRAGRKWRLSAQAAVQILFRQTKNTNSLRSKISQDKSSKFRQMEKQASFLTLLWHVTWYPRLCQTKFAFHTASTPEICELWYFAGDMDMDRCCEVISMIYTDMTVPRSTEVIRGRLVKDNAIDSNWKWNDKQ